MADEYTTQHASYGEYNCMLSRTHKGPCVPKESKAKVCSIPGYHGPHPSSPECPGRLDPLEGYDAAGDLADALRLTVEYVGNDVLPAQKGWSWFDALNRYNPDLVRPFLDNPIHFATHKDGVPSKWEKDSSVIASVMFKGTKHDPSTLSEVIGVGSGAISACWGNLSGAGIFESTRAKTIVDEMIAWIQVHYVPMDTYHDSLPEDSD